jgi:hypothetical protein
MVGLRLCPLPPKGEIGVGSEFGSWMGSRFGPEVGVQEELTEDGMNTPMGCTHFPDVLLVIFGTSLTLMFM